MSGHESIDPMNEHSNLRYAYLKENNLRSMKEKMR
jgi:hypothetical protein